MKHMQMCMTPPQLAQLEPPHHLDSGQNCKLICSFFKKFQCRCVAVKKRAWQQQSISVKMCQVLFLTVSGYLTAKLSLSHLLE